MYKKVNPNQINMTKNILNILIIALLVILLLQRCGESKTIDKIKIIRDTVWVHTDSTIYSVPKIVKTIPYTVPVDRWNIQYLPDTNYSKLVVQYQKLVSSFLSSNVSYDSIKVDSIGHIYITDTVSRNAIIGRSTHYNLKYPIITNTIIVPESKKTQWYIGGAIQGEQGDLIDQINAGLLIKNKKDQIYGGYMGITPDGQLQFGLQSYWKIKLHR